MWPAVRHADRAPNAEAPLGEVEAVAHGPAEPVVRHPARSRLGVDAALQHEVLDQPADLVVGERRDDRRCAGRSTSAGRERRCTRRRPPRPGTSGRSGSGPRPGRGAASPRRARRGRIGTPRPGAARAGRRHRPHLRRAGRTAAAPAERRISSKRPARSSAGAPSSCHRLRATAGDARYSARSAGPTPPVGTKRTGERCGQRADRGRAAEQPGREQLDDLDAGVEGPHDLGRGRHPGQHRHAELAGSERPPHRSALG